MNQQMSRSESRMARRRFLTAVGGLVVATPWLTSLAEEEPKNLQAIGGRWYVTNSGPTIYYYQDGDRYVNLFSSHLGDANRDGITDMRLSHDETFLKVFSQGYPDHPTAVFPNSSNPNTIRAQKFNFKLALKPQLAEAITRVPMGPIGMAINGVVFFNPFEAGGTNAVEGYSEVWLDSCCGHPQPQGVYHYHKYPTCVKSPFTDDGLRHSPIIGFAWDGFPLHGPYESSKVLAKDLQDENPLDACNGHTDAQRGYHYHVTPGRFPYILGGYAGVPEKSNNHALRMSRPGPITDNAVGQGWTGRVITSVTPETLVRGQTHCVRFELQAEGLKRWHIPESAPTRVQIGPFEGKLISRNGTVVLANFEIPSDANTGAAYDCHLEFASDRGGWPGPLAIKKNEVFRISSE